MRSIQQLCEQAKSTSRILARSSDAKRCKALNNLATLLEKNQTIILQENKKDLKEAVISGLSPATQDRLRLDTQRLLSIANDVRRVSTLPDPLKEVFEEQELPNGLQVHKQRVPLGVLAVIYESRPNVSIDVSALAIRSGNAVILRGGKESIRTNKALVTCVREALEKSSLPAKAVQFIDDPDRAKVQELLRMHTHIDMLIPRGGANLHRYCRENSQIPVITGGIGVCHLYVDESADLDKSLVVIQNAKVQRPTVCNALDTVILHRNIAPSFLPRLFERLTNNGVRLHVPSENLDLLNENEQGKIDVLQAGDYDREWLSLNLNVKIVDSSQEAINFIHEHSTAHSDGILSEDAETIQHFLSEVDSAVVYINASTRFTDGSQLGLGAEVAISTQRLHARGPMALRELTTYKWIVQGKYHSRK